MTVKRPGPFSMALILLAPVVASALFVVWARVTTVRLGYELSRSESALRTLERKRADLERAVTTFRAPERLRQIGSEELGLVPPSAEAVDELAEARP